MKESKYRSAWDIVNRQNVFRDYYYYFEDISRVVKGYPNIHFRHLITPSESLGGGFMPIFDDIDYNIRLMDIGYQTGLRNIGIYL